MSELDAALDALEAMLQGESLEASALDAWRAHYEAALARTEQDEATRNRARELASRLEAAAARLAVERDALRRSMNQQAQGARALKGYKPA